MQSVEESSGQAPEAVAESRRGWLRRLDQLQNIAASAASTVGGIGNILPTYIHFGKTITWADVSLFFAVQTETFCKMFRVQMSI